MCRNGDEKKLKIVLIWTCQPILNNYKSRCSHTQIPVIILALFILPRSTHGTSTKIVWALLKLTAHMAPFFINFLHNLGFHYSTLFSPKNGCGLSHDHFEHIFCEFSAHHFHAGHGSTPHISTLKTGKMHENRGKDNIFLIFCQFLCKSISSWPRDITLHMNTSGFILVDTHFYICTLK